MLASDSETASHTSEISYEGTSLKEEKLNECVIEMKTFTIKETVNKIGSTPSGSTLAAHEDISATNRRKIVKKPNNVVKGKKVENAALVSKYLGLLSEPLKSILESGEMSDCVFVVGTDENKKTFYAHKLILSIASPAFKAFFHHRVEADCIEEKSIEVSDVTPDSFNALLRFIYADQVNFGDFQQTMDLYYVAQKYEVPQLSDQCKTKLVMTRKDCAQTIKLYEFLKKFPDKDKDFKHAIYEQMKLQLSDLSAQPSALCGIEESTLNEILDCDDIDVREIDLWFAVVAWASVFERNEDFWTMMELIVAKVRFLTMTPKEFADGPACSGLMKDEDIVTIFINLCSDKNFPLPEFDLSSCRKERQCTVWIKPFYYEEELDV